MSEGTFTCPTDECIAYIANVDAKSKGLYDRFRIVLDENPGPKNRPEILELYNVFIDEHRNRWLNAKDKLKEDCDSTFPGPCKEAMATARGYMKQVTIVEDEFSKVTGKFNAPEVEPIQPKEKEGGKIVLPSIGTDAKSYAKTALIVALLIGAGLWIGSKVIDLP